MLRLPKPVRRIGCGLLLVLWFAFLFTPCLLITLAVQQEIKITWSDVPDDALRLWTISEANARGLALATSRRVGADNGATCTIIDVRFFLWQGDPVKAGAIPSHQCACYERTKAGTGWSLLSAGPEACLMAGEKTE